MSATLELSDRDRALWDGLRTRGVTGVRELPVTPASVREADRSFGCVASTETPAEMIDWETYSVIDEILLARGGEFPEQVPLLRNHQRFDPADDVYGSAREWALELEATQWACRGYMSEPSDPADPVVRAWTRVKGGHLRAVSIGYRVYEFEDIEPGQRKKVAGRFFTAGARRLRVATRWRGHELSLTPIGADPKALIRSKGQGAAPVVTGFRVDRPTTARGFFR